MNKNILGENFYQLIPLSEKELTELEEKLSGEDSIERLEIEQYNNQIDAIIDSVEKLLLQQGDDKGTVKRKLGVMIKWFTYKRFYSYTSFRPNKIRISVNPDQYLYLKYDIKYRSLVDYVKEIKGLLQNNDKQVRINIASTKFCVEHGFDVTQLTQSEINWYAQDLGEDEFLEANYPKGSIVEHSWCSCGEWMVGEPRCICGNRRLFWEIVGDIVDGFYAEVSAD